MSRVRPNAAIGYDVRRDVGEAIIAACEDSPRFKRRSTTAIQALLNIGTRLTQAGPPLVSTADVLDVLVLVRKLCALKPGETLDHEWGFVHREADGAKPGDRDLPYPVTTEGGLPFFVPGFRLADPGESRAGGSWRDSDAVHLAQEMYERHLARRGLVPR